MQKMGPTEKTFAVTGATGHLGVNLVLALLARGHSVRALSHLRKVPALLKTQERLTWHECDILDPESLKRAFTDAEGVFHLAGKISIDGDADGTVWKTNVDGAACAVQAARDAGVRRFIYCSSVHALRIDSSTQTVDESLELCDQELGRSAYDRSKAAGLRSVEDIAGSTLELVTVLPSGIIGPHDPAPSRMGRVFLDLLHGRLPALTQGGFDFVDARDVSSGMIAAVEQKNARHRYVLGGRYVKMTELAALAATIAGFRPPRLIAPLAVAKWSAPLSRAWSHLRGTEPLYTPESVRTLQTGRPTNWSKAASELNYEPRTLDETLCDLYASFRDPTLVLL